MAKGFTTKTIPAQTFQVCNGCDHLGCEKTMFGHNDVKGGFYCCHPDDGGDLRFNKSKLKTGRYIKYSSVSDSIPVPFFCPYLPNNTPKTQTDAKD